MSSIRMTHQRVKELCESKLDRIYQARFELLVKAYNDAAKFENFFRRLVFMKPIDMLDAKTMKRDEPFWPSSLIQFEGNADTFSDFKMRYWQQEAMCLDLLEAATESKHMDWMTVDTSDYGWIS